MNKINLFILLIGLIIGTIFYKLKKIKLKWNSDGNFKKDFEQNKKTSLNFENISKEQKIKNQEDWFVE